MLDFGDQAFDEALSVLINSIEREASLNFLGRIMARQMIVNALANRLRIQSEITARPESTETSIERPLFIIGYPRTGTTLLHNLLALDPHNRTVKMYEALCPVPPRAYKSEHGDPRIKEAEKFIRATHYLSPQVPIIHPLSAQGPDECLKLIENTFTSPHFLLYFDIPGYWMWLLARDPSSFVHVYEYHRQQLQIMEQGSAGIRWVLKAPAHLFFLDSLLKVYPDASIVILHREPEITIPSFCSLLAVSRSMASGCIDTHRIGEFALDLYIKCHEYASTAKNNANNSHQFYDVDYHCLMEDPVATVKNIYAHFGYDAGSDFESLIKNWLNLNPQHKHGIHRYSMEKFGLNQKQLMRFTQNI